MNRQDILSGARSVTNVGRFFDELRPRVAEMAQQARATQRGYVTPKEEEEIQGILISYWQSRNALLELISSYREDRQLSEEERPLAFLTAFAAAVLLVDAARFLRETAHDRPIVRAKLNEPAPEFGVEPGVYDRVQKSLLSARNAWHLYYAVRYYEENRQALRGKADSTGLGEMVEIIESRWRCLDVSLAHFARLKLRARGAQILRHLSRGLLGRALYGLQKFGGTMVADRYLRRGHRPGLPADVAQQFTRLLQPGDVLVVRKEFALTNYFLPGYWPHVALFLGSLAELDELGLAEEESLQPRWSRLLENFSAEEKRVLEAMRDGVSFRSLASPFASDSIVALRPQLDRLQIREAITRGVKHEGKPYDFDFDFRRADRLVCTEVVYRAFEGVGPIAFPLKIRVGRPTLSGSDLIELGIAGNFFDPVAVYAPRIVDRLAFDEEARHTMRAGQQQG